jgi:hypothetical protein
MSFKRRLRSYVGAGIAIFAGIALTPAEAKACGGFFCSLSPVDQTAEHIVFTVNGDHTVTAYVQIQYVGDKDDFAWIIPAPGIPTLNTDMPDAAMRALDTATQPQYFKQSCNNVERFAPTAGVGGATATASMTNGASGVTVLATQAVGPFDTVTLEGTSADVLVMWLNMNGYRITQKMIPLIQPYVEAGMHFVAMKLQADKAVSDIKPIGMTYDSDQPLIPLRLTSVAAQPEMGIVTFILADKRWAPQNYIDLKIPDSLIQFDQYGNQNNYLRLVSSESDKVGGQAFVTEYAKATTDLADQIRNMFVNPNIQDAQAAQTELVGLLDKYPYLTRLYARISAEEMTADPVFMVSSQNADVSNVHDLTDPNFNFSQCQGVVPPLPLPPAPCNFSYCGRRGACTSLDVAPSSSPNTTMPTAACVCANDATARITTTGANGTPAIYCESVAVNLDDTGTGTAVASSACDGFDCGPHGACVPMNGNPTCQCEAGYAAIVGTAQTSTTGATVTTIDCRQVTGTPPSIPTLPPVGQTKIPSSSQGGDGGSSGTGTSQTSSGGAGGGTSTSAGSGGDTSSASGGGTSTSSESGGGSTSTGPTNPAAPKAPRASDSSSGCNVGRARSSSVSSLLFAFAAAAAARRRRKSRVRT